MSHLSQININRNVTIDDIRNNFKLEYIAKFEQELLNSKGKKNKNQICKDIGISNTTLKRYMKDLGMNSFYRHDEKLNRKKRLLLLNLKYVIINLDLKRIKVSMIDLMKISRMLLNLCKNNLYKWH